MTDRTIDRVAAATPTHVARRVRGLSDRAIAWIFVGPTIFLLPAIKIFALSWTTRLKLPTADRFFQLHHRLDHRPRSVELRDAGLGRSRALVDRDRRHLDVDALGDADLPCRAALDPRLPLRGRRDRSGIENFKMFDLVVQPTGGGPGSVTEFTSINLKREAFEKWRTGYASAYAIILFVTVFGLASIYVKALNKVKER